MPIPLKGTFAPEPQSYECRKRTNQSSIDHDGFQRRDAMNKTYKPESWLDDDFFEKKAEDCRNAINAIFPDS